MKKETTNIKRQFFDSLKRGTGEAYLIAKGNSEIDFSNYILKGAFRNYAYDGQSEDSRAQYIYDLITLSNQKERICKIVLKGLATEKNDTWSLTQLFDLAKILAQHGDNGARQAIYDRFLNNPIEGSDWVGYSEILELGGLNGLIFIAEKFGEYIDKNPEDWQDDSILRHFQDDNPNINAFEELEKLSKINKFIKIYLDCIKRTEENKKIYVRETQIFKDIIDEVINRKPFISFRRKKELTDYEISIISKQLLTETNKLKQEKLLVIFDKRKFPFDPNFILQLAKQKPTSKNRITEYAIEALKHLKTESIRRFALDRIPKAKRPEPFIDILLSNYKKGDCKLLTIVVKKFKSEHIIESLASSYVDIYKANKTKECKEPLEVLYDKMNCGIHRKSVIEILIENNVLSNRIREEIKYDSYLETRELLKE